jgi:choice-of-anchor B domain-containing protein
MRLRLGVFVSLLYVFAAVCLSGPGLSDPAYASSPKLVVGKHDDHGKGEPGDPTPADALGSVPCTNGFADIYPCQGVDLLSFVPLADLGDIQTAGIWGWTDPATRREYALIALASRASFVDITDPGRPRIVGYLPAHTDLVTTNREINVYRDHAFVVADGAGPHGIQIFDLTRLRSARGGPVRFTETAWYGEVGRVHTLFINQETGFAYANGSDRCAGGLHMVDVRVPRKPRFAGCFSDAGTGTPYIHDVQCVLYHGPDSRFTGREICLASNPRGLQIIDVTDKSAPRLVAQATYPNFGFIHQGWLTEDHHYFLMDDEFDEAQNASRTTTHLWDVSDLTAPRRFATYTAATRATDHNQFVRGGFVYQGNYRAGLRILDLARVGEGVLTETAFFDTVPESDEVGFQGVWGSYPFFPSGNIAVSSMDRGLFVLRRVGEPSFPGPVPTVCKPSAERLCLLGNRYAVDVSWRNQFDGASGFGRAVRASDLAGYFSFGDPSNLELMIKMLDFGSDVRFFYGQLTNLQVQIRVADTKTGQVRVYGNGPNNCGAIASLPGTAAAKAPFGLLTSQVFDFAKPGRGIPATADLSGDVRSKTGEHTAGTCKPGKDHLCLGHSRFQVEVAWSNQFLGTAGTGRGTALSDLSGSFAFPDPRNVELLVKILDFDDRILVAWGTLTNLEYTLKVTDTESGAVKTYHNAAGTYCGGLDQDAF